MRLMGREAFWRGATRIGARLAVASWPDERGEILADGEHSAGEPVIFKEGTFIAPFLLTLHGVVVALVAVVCLYGFTEVYGVEYDRSFAILAVIVAVLSFLLVPPPRNVVSWLLTSRLNLALGICARWGILLGLLLTIGYLTQTSEEFSRRVLGTWALLTPTILVGCTLSLQELVRRVMGQATHRRHVIFAGCNDTSLTLAGRLGRHAALCMNVVGFFDDRHPMRLRDVGRQALLGRLSDLPEYVRSQPVDAIFVALPLRDMPRVQNLLRELQDTTASIYYLPDVPFSPVGAPVQARPCDLLGMPVVALCEGPFYGCRGAIKRLMDIGIAAALLLILSPLLLAIAVMVKVTSPGPAIFRQRRYGLNGQEIVVYKFRTMKVTEDGDEIRQATRDDPRATNVGRILRRYSLDELPQLVNVLQGRMSLVGPRPHAVAHNEQYRRMIRGYMIRHKVLPGMTGLAQVNGCRGEITQIDDLEARLRYDLEYLRRWSPLLDLKILLLTIPASLGSSKAY